MTIRFLTLATLLPAALTISACSGSPADLWPAPSAPTAATVPQTAQSMKEGVRVTAKTREWPGAAEITDDVTPLWISLDNESTRPVSVEYANLFLVGTGGDTYRALPLYRVKGDVDGGPDLRDHSPIVTPGFDSREFWLAPHYSAVYPNYPVYQRPFYYDYGYYEEYDAEATGRALPTEAMRAQALPEGVIGPGGRVEGWVYFERIPVGTEGMYVRADVEDARTGQSIATVKLPFDLPG